MMDDPLAAWSDFIAQPFGVVGAICIMLAVTAINSHRLLSKLKTRPGPGDMQVMFVKGMFGVIVGVRSG